MPALLGLLAAMVFCSHTAEAGGAIVTPKEPFQLGVYLGAHRHPSNLPVSNGVT